MIRSRKSTRGRRLFDDAHDHHAAAELTERACYGIELDPKYVDVVMKRWQELSGKEATLEGDLAERTRRSSSLVASHWNEDDGRVSQGPRPPDNAREQIWNNVSRRDRPSWYLDPLVAEQKRTVHAALVRKALPHSSRLALKTDAFEEAFGQDTPLPDLLPLSDRWLVMDGSAGIAKRALGSRPLPGVEYFSADVREMPLASASLDLVFSNSTLDHFESRADYEAAIHEISRVLRHGGRLVLTTDNPWNPGYWVLRWLFKSRLGPFPLGYTPGPSGLRKMLEKAGFDVGETGVLIHNPRGISTLLFLLLRKSFGNRADTPIRALLTIFEWMGRLPTRYLSACYHTAHAVRRPT